LPGKKEPKCGDPFVNNECELCTWNFESKWPRWSEIWTIIISQWLKIDL